MPTCRIVDQGLNRQINHLHQFDLFRAAGVRNRSRYRLEGICNTGHVPDAIGGLILTLLVQFIAVHEDQTALPEGRRTER